MAGGEHRQVLEMTNGMSLYFTTSDVVIWFGEGSSIVVGFDPSTRKPLSTLLTRAASSEEPGASILDINADGVPEIRHVLGGSKKELLYRGEWHPKEKKGSNSVITVDGKQIEVRYDGRRFVPVGN
jgi:hypothetical protein